MSLKEKKTELIIQEIVKKKRALAKLEELSSYTGIETELGTETEIQANIDRIASLCKELGLLLYGDPTLGQVALKHEIFSELVQLAEGYTNQSIVACLVDFLRSLPSEKSTPLLLTLVQDSTVVFCKIRSAFLRHRKEDYKKFLSNKAFAPAVVDRFLAFDATTTEELKTKTRLAAILGIDMNERHIAFDDTQRAIIGMVETLAQINRWPEKLSDTKNNIVDILCKAMGLLLQKQALLGPIAENEGAAEQLILIIKNYPNQTNAIACLMDLLSSLPLTTSIPLLQKLVQDSTVVFCKIRSVFLRHRQGNYYGLLSTEAVANTIVDRFISFDVSNVEELEIKTTLAAVLGIDMADKGIDFENKAQVVISMVETLEQINQWPEKLIDAKNNIVDILCKAMGLLLQKKPQLSRVAKREGAAKKLALIIENYPNQTNASQCLSDLQTASAVEQENRYHSAAADYTPSLFNLADTHDKQAFDPVLNIVEPISPRAGAS